MLPNLLRLVRCVTNGNDLLREMVGGSKKAHGFIERRLARQRHESRQPYVALLGGVDKPRFIIDVADNWVSVDFLDSRQRKYLSYNFKETESRRLFLKSAHFWDYVGDSDSPASSKLFNFERAATLPSQSKRGRPMMCESLKPLPRLRRIGNHTQTLASIHRSAKSNELPLSFASRSSHACKHSRNPGRQAGACPTRCCLTCFGCRARIVSASVQSIAD